MKLNHAYLFLLLMWGFLSSCISEDYSDCYNRYVVDLSYMGDGNKEIFADKIRKVDMYIFDQENTCVHQSHLTEAEVGNRRTVLPPLDAGQYRIVFLGNTYSTGVRNLNTRASEPVGMCFGAEAYWEDKEVSGNDSLYWASIDQLIEPFDQKMQPVFNTACFKASHYDVSVEVLGTPSDLKIVLAGVSPYTDFNNIAAVGQKTDYVLKTVYDGTSTVKAECNILRHLDHENVFLKVLSSDGIELASVNFDEFLRENSSYIDCSEQEVLIPFKIEFKSSKVEITLPDWLVTHIKPEFGI